MRLVDRTFENRAEPFQAPFTCQAQAIFFPKKRAKWPFIGTVSHINFGNEYFPCCRTASYYISFCCASTWVEIWKRLTFSDLNGPIRFTTIQYSGNAERYHSLEILLQICNNFIRIHDSCKNETASLRVNRPDLSFTRSVRAGK